MYEVSGRKITIVVGDEKLTHHFVDLQGDEWLEHQRVLGDLAGAGNDLKRLLAIYDARCKKVEGYVAGGVDLMELDGWIEKIPSDHKAAAVLELVQGNDLRKN